MPNENYAADLSFRTSARVPEQLDALMLKHGMRSRGELLRSMIEEYLKFERINPAIRTEIERDHDRLNTLGRRKPKRDGNHGGGSGA